MIEETPEPKTLPDPPTPQQYDDARIRLALSFCPELTTCRVCRWPKLYGYICTTCGDAEH